MKRQTRQIKSFHLRIAAHHIKNKKEKYQPGQTTIQRFIVQRNAKNPEKKLYSINYFHYV